MIRHAVVLIVLAGAGGCLFAQEQGNGVRCIGRMTAFWRHRPVVDRWLKDGGFFRRIPDYLCDASLSFHYRKKSAPEEIPFVDHVTVVRLLGGWRPDWKGGEMADGRSVESYDLAYRGADGRIHYRWELLPRRLDPYVENGCDLTIVLDNTPYCFPKEPQVRGLGQAAPPADFAEWGAFIEALCRELVRLYGFDRVNRWRFRMGTECQGPERFAGTQKQFFRLYDYAAAAVRRVLPGAKFGPFNLAGNPDGTGVSYHALADHCATGVNSATRKTGSPLDFAAVSLYTAPSISDGILRTTDPDHKARQKIDFWNGLAARRPQLADVSREVHEFGILGNEFNAGHGEPGARGAAWMFHIMVCLREGGLDRFWHWGVLERIAGREIHELLRSNGWLLSVLEHTVGGETYVLEPHVAPLPQGTEVLPEDLRAIASFQRPVKLRRPGRTFCKSIAVVQDRRTFIITSVYNEDRFVTRPVEIRVRLPKKRADFGARPRVLETRLTRTNAVYYRIRQDLAASGLLKPQFSAVPGLLGSVKEMGGNAAWRYVNQHWQRYETVVRDSLTLKPFTGKARLKGRDFEFSLRTAPPSVVVIVVEHRRG